MDRGTRGRYACALDDFALLTAGRFQESPSGCWEWTGRKTCGYGVVSVRGREVTIHRLACLSKNGPPPRGKGCACHTCDNRGCINPDHLYWGSRRDNAIDFVKRDGRSLKRLRDLGERQRGERHPMARLTSESVAQIREILPSLTDAKIAARYGVHPSTVWLIRKGKTWAKD